MNQYDMHTHILPGIDDGAKDLQDALQLVKKLQSDGVTHIALTPHFYSDRESLSDFLTRREQAYNVLLQAPVQGVTYILASEAYITDYIFNNSSLLPLCYSGTGYLLVEFPYSIDFAARGGDMLYKLMNNYGVHPVIAHIERYYSLMKDPALISELQQMGCKMQINLGSLSFFSRRRKLLGLIKRNLVDLVGTDTHSLARGADFSTGMGIISKKLGNDYIDTIQKNSKSVILS
ncbi:MAG: CpsB/CapC family capsule biosynthesis tyrosine phosphatase [Acutalibacteraceae bacterium]|nr:CpsB/CapC family capsule biosynthesis tyrosine phosphatase [Acutalibacteraceae bacterium]HIR02964.1 hypothetical protein [Candidatus Scatovicinus merdipullorum]